MLLLIYYNSQQDTFKRIYTSLTFNHLQRKYVGYKQGNYEIMSILLFKDNVVIPIISIDDYFRLRHKRKSIKKRVITRLIEFLQNIE